MSTVFSVVVSEYERVRNSTDPKELKMWAGHCSNGVREVVARSSYALPETLSFLAGDWYANVRSAVASNVNTPVDVLMCLAHDKDMSVWHSLALNSSTPPVVRARMVANAKPKNMGKIRKVALLAARKAWLEGNVNAVAEQLVLVTSCSAEVRVRATVSNLDGVLNMFLFILPAVWDVPFGDLVKLVDRVTETGKWPSVKSGEVVLDVLAPVLCGVSV